MNVCFGVYWKDFNLIFRKKFNLHDIPDVYLCHLFKYTYLNSNIYIYIQYICILISQDSDWRLLWDVPFPVIVTTRNFACLMGDAYELVCHCYHEGEHPKIYLAPLCHLIGTVIPHPPQSFSDHHGTWESKALSPEFKGPRPLQMPTPQWNNVPKGLIFPGGIMAGGTFFLKRRPAVVWGGVAFLRKRYLHHQNIPTKNTKTSGGMTGCLGIDGLPSVWWRPLNNQPHIHN